MKFNAKLILSEEHPRKRTVMRLQLFLSVQLRLVGYVNRSTELTPKSDMIRR